MSNKTTVFLGQNRYERRVLNELELADRWGMSNKTLQRWRSEGRGPKYLKLSKRVGYPLEFRPRPLLEEAGWKERLPLGDLVFAEKWGQR